MDSLHLQISNPLIKANLAKFHNSVFGYSYHVENINGIITLSCLQLQVRPTELVSFHVTHTLLPSFEL